MKGTNLPDRFWDKVSKDTNNGCWVWTAGKDKDGYGKFWWQGATRRAVRVLFSVDVEPILPGYLIDHKCYNPPCVNPTHLQQVTHKQNCENLSGITKRNTSGVRSVYRNKAKSKWQVMVGHNNGLVFGGYFDDLHEADVAARALRNQLHTNNLMDRGTR